MTKLRRTGQAGMVLCAGVLMTAGCARPINRAAERRFRDALPGILGPARTYRVRVDNDPLRTVQGRLSRVTVEGEEVMLSNGLPLDRLRLELKGVRIDTGRGEVQSVEEARFTATISAPNLNEYFAGEAPPGERLKRTRLSFEPGNRVTIHSVREVLGVDVPFSLSGPIRLVNGRKISFDPNLLRVVGLPVVGGPIAFLLDRFERALDVSLLPFPITLTDVQTGRASVTLTGAADVAALLDRAKAAGSAK